MNSPNSLAVSSRPVAAPPSKQANNTPLRILSNILRMHWLWTMLLGVALAALSVGAILWFWRPTYEAKMYLRVIQNPAYFQVIPEKFQAQTNPKDELAPIRSELLLSKVLTDQKIRSLPSLAKVNSKVKQLTQMISYRSAGGQELYEIVCASPDRKEAVTVVAAVTDVYLDYVRALRDSRLNEINRELSEEIALKRQEIEAINAELSQKAGERQGALSDNSIYDPDGEYLTELQKSRTELEIELQALQAELELAPALSPGAKPAETSVAATDPANTAAGNEAAAGGGNPAIPTPNGATAAAPPATSPATPVPTSTDLDVRIESQGEVQELKRSRNELLVQRRDKISRGKGENHPEIKSLDLSLRRIEADLAEARELARQALQMELAAAQVTGGDTTTVVVGPDRKVVPSRAVELSGKIASLQRQMEYYDKEIQEQRARINDNNRLRWQFESKQLELTRATTELERMLDAESTLHFRKLSLPYQIVREGEAKPEIPEAPLEEYPMKLLALALAASFGIPFGLAFLWETRAKRISEPDQLAQNLPCGVVGEVAMVPLQRIGVAGTQVRLARDKQIYQESVDKIGTLLALTAEEGNQIIAITSAVSHEGKSTLSSQLAISLARSTNQEVLLIDADLRSPVQHRLFELSNMVGLSDAINDPANWEATIVETKIRNLSVLPAGRAPAKPASCFVNASWEDLLERAQSRFGIIVVDTPPVLSTSEAVAICRAADRTLLCVLRDVSRTDAVHRAHAHLTAARVNVLGCVFGGSKQSAYTYRYGNEYKTDER